MREYLKKTGKSALMLIGVVILILLLAKVGVNEFISIVKGMSPLIVIIAIVPWVVTLLIGAYRLKKLVRSDVGYYEMFKIYCYGYLLNYASPIQGFGAGAKVAMLKMKKVKISKSSASISSEIGYDFILAVIIFAIFFFSNIDFVFGQLKNLLNVKFMYAGTFIVIVLLIAAYMLRKNEFVIEFFSHLMHSFKPKNIMRIMPITLFLWVLPALVVFLFFYASGNPISYWIVLGSICTGFIFGMASFIPGGLGVRDAITAYVYSLSGISIETTIAIAIFNRFFTIGTVLLVVAVLKIYEVLK